jgi:hypothetical protein
MSSQRNQPNDQKPGGFPVDYRPKPLILRKASKEDHQDYIDSWITDRRTAIFRVREHGDRVQSGMLDNLSLEMIHRWQIAKIGRSPVAWMERDVTSAAMLLDHRSRRFGRRVHSSKSRERDWLDDMLSRSAECYEDFQPFSPQECQQANRAVVFAREWQRYLGTLLIRPPGAPPPATEPFPSCYSMPSASVSRIIAELAHCRPSGAFFYTRNDDDWIRSGGRPECRKPLNCPHCHARQTARLVERVGKGPWVESRQTGRQLVLVRVAVSTEGLQLSRFDLDEDRDRLGFDGWLRPSVEDYTASPGDETMIRNIDCNQSLDDSLTTIEVAQANQRLDQLVVRCQNAGMDGGIRFHAIGPKQRKFQHELSVVGEVTDENLSRFKAEFGVPRSHALLNDLPIECIVFAPSHTSAARVKPG